MRKWLLMALVLGTVVTFGSTSWSASQMVVSGVINNWREVKARVPANAYLQLVKIEDKMKGSTDAQGLSAFDSKFPKVTVRANGSFRLDLKNLPEGKYFIALQRAIDSSAIKSGTPLLITGEGSPLIIEIPGEFPRDMGKVDIGVLKK